MLAGTGSIELSWDSNTESDLKGYAVYRAAGDGDFERTGELVAAPSFSDRRVESGKRYRYLVTALDLRGNESTRSEVKEIIMP